jgi:hypothetical protein
LSLVRTHTHTHTHTMQTTAETIDLSQSTISDIARIVSATWPKVNYAAKPYLDAMRSLHSIGNAFHADDGKSIVLYFLSNASSYRGETAKLVKAELKKRVGIK